MKNRTFGEPRSYLHGLWTFIIRHRITIQDIALLAATLGVAAYILYGIDVFETEGLTIEQAIEADEWPILGAILSLGLLIFSWRRMGEQKRETSRRVQAERHARELALQDPLTGLPNRRRFTEALQEAVDSPPGAGHVHAAFMIDLNGFKQINDVYGHGVGDAVLVIVGERLLSAVRNNDLVARLGGDEFAIVARHLASAEAATNVALRILAALAQPLQAGGMAMPVGLGIGIALFPVEGAGPQEIMRRADIALYAAKSERKSAFRFFDAEIDASVREREYFERELRAAITANDINPYFQPLVNLKTNEVIGFESLARWTHKSLGAVPPQRFIPVAEAVGLISDLTDYLLRQSCLAARQWPAHVTLSFNVSPIQLKDTTLGLRIMRILAETGLQAERLELEITENAVVQDLDAAKSVLGLLRQMGVRIALDDFGTGYSNLYHLRAFKVDKIKIDRSFVSRMGSERESAAIVKALVGLGHGLGMTVTAEGVEGEDQNEALMEEGCEQGQGYLFGRAVSARDSQAFFHAAEPQRVTAS